MRDERGSGGLKWMVWGGGEEDFDGVVWMDGAAFKNDGEDAGAGGADAWVKAGPHETGAEAVHELAGRAEVGELNQRGGAEAETRAEGQGAEGEAAGGEIFAHLAREDAGMKGGVVGEGVEELGFEKMDLGEVGGGRVFADEIAVAHGGAAVGVALHAEAGNEVDGGLGIL